MEQLIKVENTDLDCDDLANQRRDLSSQELTKSNFEDLWKELAKLKEELSREQMYCKKLAKKYQSNNLKLNNGIMLSTNQPYNAHLGNVSQPEFKKILRPRSVKKSQCAVEEQHRNGIAPAVEKLNLLIPNNLERSKIGNKKEIREIARKRFVRGYHKEETVNQVPVLGLHNTSASSGHLDILAYTDLVYGGKIRDQQKAVPVRARAVEHHVINSGMKQRGAVKQYSTQVLHLRVPKGRCAADCGTKAGTKQLLENFVIRTDKNMKRLLQGKELDKLLMSPVVKIKRVDVNGKCVAMKSLTSDETCAGSPVKIKDKTPDAEMTAAKTLHEVTQTKFYRCIMKTSQDMVIRIKLTKEQPPGDSSVTETTGTRMKVPHQTSHSRTRKSNKASERNRYHMRISSKPSELCKDSSRKLCETRRKCSSNILEVRLSRKRLITRSVAKRGKTVQRTKLDRAKSLPSVIKPGKLTEVTNHQVKIEKNNYNTHYHTYETEPLHPYHLSDKNFGKRVAPNIMYIQKKHLLPLSETSFVTDGHTTDVVSHSKMNSDLSEMSTVKQRHKQNTAETSETEPQKNCQEKPSDGHLLQSNHHKETLRSSFVVKKSQVTTCLAVSHENRDQRSKMKRRHRCKVCRKCFGTAHQLIGHVKQVHQSPFYCRSCRTHFSTDSEYRTHLESHCKGENQNNSEVSPAPSSCDYGRLVKVVECVMQAQIKDKKKGEADEDHTIDGKESEPLESRSVKTIGQGIGETQGRVHKDRLETDTRMKRLRDASAEMISVSLSKKIVNGETIRGKDFAKNLCLLWIDSHEEKIPAENLGFLEFFCCEWCGVKFQSIGQLEMHSPCISTVHVYLCNRFGCGKCRESFTTIMNLWNHVFDCHLTKLYGCDNCDKTFDKKANCAEHLLAHADIDQNSCERCGRSFKSVLQLNRHQYSVCRAKLGNGEKSFNDRIKIRAALNKLSIFQCSSSKKLFCAKNNAGKFRAKQDFEQLILPKDESPEHHKMPDCDDDDCVSDNDLYNEEDSNDEEWNLENWKHELKRKNRIKQSRKIPWALKVGRKTKCSAVDK